MGKLNCDYFSIADNICKREYEKKFGFDLNLPIGHPQNRIASIELTNILEFWTELKEKNLAVKHKTILHKMITRICDLQINGIIKIISY